MLYHPPIWYQTAVLSLLGEDTLGLDSHFGSQHNLDLWITFFTIVWVLLEIALLGGVLSAVAVWWP